MRVAATILGLVLSVAFAVQALAGNALGSIANDEATVEATSVGLVAAFLMLLGGAFAYGLPVVAAVLFALSGLFALAGRADYPDLAWWSGVAFVLAGVALLGWVGKRRAERRRRDEVRRLGEGWQRAFKEGLAEAETMYGRPRGEG
jgi:hypothetical protein